MHVGDKIGMLTVIEYDYKFSKGLAICKCDCGNTTTITNQQYKHNQKKSCGCLKRKQLGIRRKTHGMTDSQLYISHKGLKQFKRLGEDFMDFMDLYKFAVENGYDENCKVLRVDTKIGLSKNNYIFKIV